MKLAIGTAQFGLDYGLTNSQGKTPKAEVCAILKKAKALGIDILDTAPAYGDSELVLGEAMSGVGEFSVITKTPTFGGRPIGPAEVAHVEEMISRSLERLRLPFAEGLLLHHALDCIGENGIKLIECLQSLKGRGLVRKIGISVYDANELDEIVKQADIDLVQVPMNVLDQRLIVSGHLRRLKKRGIEIHARSIFLQGLLLSAPESLPDFFSPIRVSLETFHAVSKERGLDPLAASLAFVASIPEIDVAICGINCVAQLQEIADRKPLFDRPEDWGQFALNDPRFLNPAQWRI